MFNNTSYIGVVLCLFCVCFIQAEETSPDDDVVSNIEFSAQFLAPAKQIDTDVKLCALSNLLPVACTALQVCVKHGELSENVDVLVEFALDVDVKIPRLYFLQPEGMFMEKQIWPLDNTTTGACIQRMVFLRDDADDKFSPIAAEVKFSVKPVENDTIVFTKTSRDAINITRNCGDDDFCEPKLKLDVLPNFPTYIIGSFQMVELGISVANGGEDSFETYLNITLPEDVAFVNVKMVTDPPVMCFLGNGSQYLLCDIGNPLQTAQAVGEVQFIAVFQPIVIEGIAKSLDFAFCLNTSAPEDKQKNSEAHAEVSIAVDVSSKLRLEVASSPEKVTYKKSDYDDEEVSYLNELGPKVVYKYGIINEGLIGVEEIDVRIISLNTTVDGKELVYPVEEPIVTGVNVTCESVPVNPDNYKVESDEQEKSEGANAGEKEEGNEKESDEDEENKDEAKSRKRRYIAPIVTSIDMIEAGILSQCKEKQCSVLKCKVRDLVSQDAATIEIATRLNVRSLKEINPSDPPTVGSVLLAEITKLPFIERPGHLEIYSKQISTDIVPEEE